MSIRLGENTFYPWEVERQDDETLLIVSPGVETLVAVLTHEPAAPERRRVEADARLLAAAPDMADLLIDLVACFDAPGPVEPKSVLANKCRAVLAKAVPS